MARIIPFVSLLLLQAACAAGAVAAEDPSEQGASPEQAMAPTQAEEQAPADASQVQLQENAPGRYIVKKGDTLWGISSHFLKNPWKWPDVWGINRDAIRNPHRIYPGDVVILDLTGATPRLRLEGESDGGMSRWYGLELQTSRLSPQMRSEALARAPIPAIPARAIEPFLIRPLVVDQAQVSRAPRIVSNVDARVAVGAGDTAYVQGLDRKRGTRYQVYRQGRVFQDPETRELLGYEAVYLGEADVTTFGEVSAVRIASAQQEIAVNDRLTVAPKAPSSAFIPRAPERKVRGQVIAGTDGTVSEIGALSVVILNRGARNGIEPGHVLGLYRAERPVPVSQERQIRLPEERYGLLLIFRVFERISYGLVLTAKRPVNVLDAVANP
jgi:nucleoid-associated protein YgaU